MDRMVAEHRWESESMILVGDGHSAFLLMRCMAMVVPKAEIPRVTCIIKNPSTVVLLLSHIGTLE
jgi:hypothetical protein